MLFTSIFLNRKLLCFRGHVNDDEVFLQGLKKKEHLEFVDIVPDHDYHHHEDKDGWKIEVTQIKS